MWYYEKRLIYPVKITRPNPRMAKLLLAQYGGNDSELGASIRYLTQRYSMPNDITKAALTDIGTEEMAHWEMLGTMIRHCLKCATKQELREAGMEGYYVNHSCGVYPQSPDGQPFTADCLACKGNPIADIIEDMAAEQKARATYEHIISLSDDPDITDPLRFLREREIVHFQRFGECLNILQGLKNERESCNRCSRRVYR